MCIHYIYIYICTHTCVGLSGRHSVDPSRIAKALHSSKGGAVETGCGGLHYIIGCFTTKRYPHPLHPPPTAPPFDEYPIMLCHIMLYIYIYIHIERERERDPSRRAKVRRILRLQWRARRSSRHPILYYYIIFYTILYYTILYYTILYYTILPARVVAMVALVWGWWWW